MTEPTIFEALRQEHDHQRALSKRIVATSGDTAERATVFAELKDSLQAHAIAEERHFYVPLMQHDLTQEKARHSVAEHKDIDDILETLVDTEMSSPAWLVHAKNLEERVLHHLEEEEHEVFQLAGKVLTESAKIELVGAYQREMKQQRQLPAAQG